MVALFGIASAAVAATFGRSEPTVVAVAAIALAATILVVLHYTHLRSVVEQTRAEMNTRELYYRTLSQTFNDVLVVLDRDNKIIDYSRPIELDDAELDEMMNQDTFALVHPEDRDTVDAIIARCWAQPGVELSAEIRLRPLHGQEPWIEVRYINLSHLPHVGGLVINIRDITERKRTEAAIAHQALHDSLTGLANRALLGNRIDHALGRLSRDGGEVAVVFCDIDGFKAVNESLGQHAGDIVLKRVGERLASAVRAGDTVARMSGDEFAILIDSVGDFPGSAARALDRIRSSFSQPIEIDGTLLVISCSTGVATAETGRVTADELLRHADLALYQAKRQGRGQQVYWQPDLGEAVANRLQLEADLRVAVEQNQLVLHYQPLVDLGTGQLRGFEALVRWNHPRRGLLMPLEFITIAEESGLIIEVGEWVLRTACETAAGWARLTPERPSLEMSVNLSARQLADPNLTDVVSAVLDDTGMDPRMLVLELTESVLVNKADRATEALARLGERGIRLAIDDFGTGYSSLAYLQQFPVDIIKIDRAFVNTITGIELPPLVRGMIDLSGNLGAVCIAEGIEDPVQVSALQGAGCDLGQGYLFSRPIDVTQASTLVHGRRDFSRAGA